MCFTHSLLVNLEHPRIVKFQSKRVKEGSFTTVTLEPTWSWRHDVKPLLEKSTEFCHLEHRIRILSGELAIRFLDGFIVYLTNETEPFIINEPHDVWVVGENRCVFTQLELIDLEENPCPMFRKSCVKKR